MVTKKFGGTCLFALALYVMLRMESIEIISEIPSDNFGRVNVDDVTFDV